MVRYLCTSPNADKIIDILKKYSGFMDEQFRFNKRDFNGVYMESENDIDETRVEEYKMFCIGAYYAFNDSK